MVKEFKGAKIRMIRAGSLSAAVTFDDQVSIWGYGIFGNFDIPHRVKSASALDVIDI